MINFDIRSVQDEFSKNQIRTSHFEFLYVTFLESIYDDLKHSFNTVKPRRFLKSLPDAYSKKSKTIFYAMGCIVHGDFRTEGDVCKPCSYLPIGTTLSDKNIYGEVYAVKKQRFDKMISRILKVCDEVDRVTLMYQCDFEKKLQTAGTDIFNFFNKDDNITPKTKPPPPFCPRAGKEVYRCQVFNC